MTTFTKEYTAIATSAKYGEAQVTLTLNFDNESNTSTLTIGDGFVMGGQTTGYTGEGVAMATSKADGNCVKFYSLKQLTKLGTNHLFVFKADETEFNKHTRYICDLTMLAITIKSDIYNWRKSLSNE
jgi:hypothetical protein